MASSLIEAMERCWLDESQGSALDRAYRRGHNAGVRTAIDVVRVHAGLRELAAAPAQDLVRRPQTSLGVPDDFPEALSSPSGAHSFPRPAVRVHSWPDFDLSDVVGGEG